MQEPVKALMQSYSPHQGEGLQVVPSDHGADHQSSNNTIFADADGDIA